MSAPRNPYSEPNGDHMLTPSESTDSDELHNRDGDQTVEPPEGWHGANQFGLLEDEAEHGETLDAKLAAEEPDLGGDEPLSDTAELDPEGQEDLGLIERAEPESEEDASFFPVADEHPLDTN